LPIVAVLPFLCINAAEGQEPAVALQPATQPATSPADEIPGLIEQLGNDRWKVREAAHQKLREVRNTAVIPALRHAAESQDLEVAIRAKLLLAELLNFTHVIVDALGQPIAEATITVVFAEAASTPVVLKTNLFGGVSIPAEARRQGTRLRFYHPRFGLAEGPVPWGPPTVPEVPPVSLGFRVPVVQEGTEARTRALKGVVIGPDDKPVADARIVCNVVRTPGEGLIQYHEDLTTVLTDAQGRFAIYVPDPNPRNERGKLIPLKSRYYVSVKAETANLFPYVGEYYNSQEATIRLARPELFHRFEFEAPGGGRVTGPQLGNLDVYVTYQPGEGGGKPVRLDARYAKEGGKLLPGRYTAKRGPSGTEYLPLEVTKDSPETLLFRLPPPVTYRGQVIDGATGQPLAGVFVIGYDSTVMNNGLAQLTDEDWKQLEAMPANPPLDAAGVKRLQKHYGVQAITRTDDQGMYDLVQPVDQKFYGLISFARDRVPYTHRTYKLTPNDKLVATVPDLLLFPAARIMVKPVVEGHASVSPKWLLAAGNQPEWYGRLKASSHVGSSEGHVEYVHWLRLNESQPIYVPADVELKLIFETPYDEQLCAARCDKVIRLAAGKSTDSGEVTFAKAFRATVQVVDQAGKGVEGAAVRRMYEGSNTWSVAHNTDKGGLVQFFVERNSKGYFGIADLLRGAPVLAPDAPLTVFEVGDEAPVKPLLITLTPAQIKALLGS
jgi:hypothetical protein